MYSNYGHYGSHNQTHDFDSPVSPRTNPAISQQLAGCTPISEGKNGKVYSHPDGFLRKVSTQEFFGGFEQEVHCFNLVHGEGSAFLVHPKVMKMKKVEGTPLNKINVPTVITEAQLLEFKTDLKNCGVRHGDLEADNMILGEDGKIRCVDFGEASIITVPLSSRVLERTFIDYNPIHLKNK